MPHWAQVLELPIQDSDAGVLEAVIELCEELERRLRHGEVVYIFSHWGHGVSCPPPRPLRPGPSSLSRSLGSLVAHSGYLLLCLRAGSQDGLPC